MTDLLTALQKYPSFSDYLRAIHYLRHDQRESLDRCDFFYSVSKEGLFIKKKSDLSELEKNMLPDISWALRNTPLSTNKFSGLHAQAKQYYACSFANMLKFCISKSQDNSFIHDVSIFLKHNYDSLMNFEAAHKKGKQSAPFFSAQNRIAKFRLSAGLTLRELAYIFGVSLTTMFRYSRCMDKELPDDFLLKYYRIIDLHKKLGTTEALLTHIETHKKNFFGGGREL